MWRAVLLILAAPGFCSPDPQSGRRSDAFTLQKEVARRQLTYAQPPRSREEQEPEPVFEKEQHFLPTAPSVSSRRSSVEATVLIPSTNSTDKGDLLAEICRFSQHSLCNLFRPQTAAVAEVRAAELVGLKPVLPREPEIQRVPGVFPEPSSEEEKNRFMYRHNYPYRRQDGRRQQLLGDWGVRDERRLTTSTTTTTMLPPVTSSTASPRDTAGPFVTMDSDSKEKEKNSARQPKDYDYGADSRVSEVRVLPPKEFRHLLAQVDGIEDGQDDTETSEQRMRPSVRGSKKFRGVPGTAGRDFPTLGSIPMTTFSCIGTKAGFYADLEANCQVYHYCHFDGRQDSFLCANGTVFNQKVFTCDWWYNVNCAASEDLYSLNDNLYKDESSLFAESEGGSGNDFDLSKLQKLLKINTMEIDNLLSPSRDSFSTARGDSEDSLPLSLIRSSSGKSIGLQKIQGATSMEDEDISVSYESRPNGGFNVFYTIPKEPVEATKMDKLKALIERVNAKEKFSNNDYEEDYYGTGEYEENDIDSYEVEEYYDDGPEQELLTDPPDISDDYYDPGPPDSYYDNAAEEVEYDDYDDDYYYDAAEDRMMVEASTMAPSVLSPTVQRLNEITEAKMMLLRKVKKLQQQREKKKKKPRKNKKVDIKGQIERTPVEQEDDFIVIEDTTKRNFNPSTHRSIRINPTTAIVDQSSLMEPNSNGFLGLFATLNPDGSDKEPSTTPKYLGTLDIEDLKKFQQFQHRSNGDPQKIKSFLANMNKGSGFAKRMSRDQGITGTSKRKSLKRQRKNVPKPTDDADQKIEALQVMVTSNIQNSLAERRRQYLAQKAPAARSPVNIHTMTQVEKPGAAYNGPAAPGFPFLMQDTPPVRLPQTRLLPFLAPAQQAYGPQPQPNPADFTFKPKPLTNQGHNFVLLQNMNSAPAPPAVLYGPTLPPAYSFTAADTLDSRVGGQQNIFQMNQEKNLFDRPVGGREVSMDHISEQLRRAREEQVQLQSQLDQLSDEPRHYAQPESSFVTPHINFGQLQSNFGTLKSNYQQPQSNFVTPRTSFNPQQNNYANNQPQQNIFVQAKPQNSYVNSQNNFGSSFSSPAQSQDFTANSRRDYPRTLNFGLPMNFEDMMNTGLSLAKQSQKYHPDVVNLLPSTPAPPTRSPQEIWNSQYYSSNNYIPGMVSNSKPPGPSRSEERLPEKGSGRVHLPDTFIDQRESTNSVNTDEIHIIGPNCYVMSKSGFKLVGKAPHCRPDMKKDGSKRGGERRGGERRGGSNIWDSLTSLPLVSKFAQTLGMRRH